MKKWLLFAAACLGLLALCLIIWFLLPIVAFGGVQPFASVWLRLALIAFLITVFAGYYTYKYYRQRQASAALASELSKPAAAEPQSDAKQLSDKMSDAIATLRKAHNKKGDFLYDLPWYIIIGPPGAGKTTALLNSGLKFPLATGKDKRPISGVGGTRYCDWWFTEEAVLIDTAGRYTTQDSDAAADKASWLSFLGLLKRNRPLQPINGVMVAISLADLMNLPPGDLSDHANAIRRRLNELHEQLKIDFPVYVMFTKADLTQGFGEFFSTLSEQRRRLVWGATFNVKAKSENKVSEVGAEFDLLIDRLSQEMPDRLQEEGDPINRVRIFAFPSQMASLREPIVEFLNQIFEPTRYQTNVPLRGFYFTSGTQEGTPIDRLIGAMQGMAGGPLVAPAYAGKGKSYFLGDLLTKVIFGEAGWVSTSRAAVQRKLVLTYAGYGAVAICTAVILALWSTSYLYNRRLIDQTNLAIEAYNQTAAPLINEEVVADGDFTKPLDLLSVMRNLPAGYGGRDESTPVAGTFGLSQRERLVSASSAAYQMAIDRTLRARLVYYVEQQLEKNKDNPAFVYEALKVYLMLGKPETVPVDKALLLDWMRQEWNSTDAKANDKARKEFLDHIEAMVDMDHGGGVPVVALNGALVEECQHILARLSLADRAYAILKSSAEADATPDWLASDNAGPDAALVFDTKDGSELNTVKVSKFFTYYGFRALFLARIGDVADQLQNERWVLGDIGQQEIVKSQLDTIGASLLDKYSVDFVKEWTGALDKLKLRSLAADKSNYAVLQSISGPSSPLRVLLESVNKETSLTAEPPKAADNGSGAAGSVAGATAEVVGARVESNVTGLARVGLDIARKSQLRAGASGGAGGGVPGQDIENSFRRFHEFVIGDAGQRPIDLLLANLSGIYNNLMIAKTDPNNKASAVEGVQSQVAALRGQNANRLPPPFDRMMYDAANEFEADAANTTVADLNAQLQNLVTGKCLQIVNNRYPFATNSKRQVPWVEFAKLFAPGGVIDQFFTTKLQPLVDQSGPQWQWSDKTPVGRELSASSLKQFQNAAKIRDAFFPMGGQVPNIALTVTPLTLSQNATGAEFEVNGDKLESIHGIVAPKQFQWPGANLSDGTASVTLLPEMDNGGSKIDVSGAWALYQLFEKGGMSQSGDKLSVRFVVAGREVSYQIKVGSLQNPFALPALRSFVCPKNL